MERNLTEEEKEKLINCGAFGYDYQTIAAVLNIEDQEAENLLKKGSEGHKLYERGQKRAEYVIDLKLFEMAQSGDLKALEKFERRKVLRS
uniref:hypothetical protein n=1 Tax=Roseivirga sp. TaxID=1964215 RepID=UPI004047E20F